MNDDYQHKLDIVIKPYGLDMNKNREGQVWYTFLYCSLVLVISIHSIKICLIDMCELYPTENNGSYLLSRMIIQNGRLNTALMCLGVNFQSVSLEKVVYAGNFNFILHVKLS